jgi:hypothetical protein
VAEIVARLDLRMADPSSSGGGEAVDHRDLRLLHPRRHLDRTEGPAAAEGVPLAPARFVGSARVALGTRRAFTGFVSAS